MKCSNCGYEISDGMNACPNCKTAINVIPSTPTNPVLPKDQGIDLTQNLKPVNNEAQILPTSVDQINGKMSNFEEAPVIKKEKKKINFKIVIVILVLIIILTGVGVFFYIKEYKSSTKRVSNVIDKLFTNISKYNNDSIELGSGEYKLDYSIDYNNKSFSTNVNGKYNYDLNNRIIDLQATIENMKIDNADVLSNKPINSELYIYDNVIYILMSNFLDQYIHMNIDELPSFIQTFDKNLYKGDLTKLTSDLNKVDYKFIKNVTHNISQNDINYTLIINSIKSSLKTAFDGEIINQSITNKGGFKNVVEIKLDKQGQKKFIKTLYKSLLNNSNFKNDILEITGYDEDHLELLMDPDNVKNIEDINIKVYTSLFKNEFDSLVIESKDKIITVSVIENGYKVNYKNNGVDILDLDYTVEYNYTSTTNEKIRNINYTYYKDKVSYKSNIKLDTIGNVNPKVEKVNTKNTVKYNNLSKDNYDALEKGLTNYGKLGLYLNDYIKYDKTAYYCSISTNCKQNEDGTKTCSYCETSILPDGTSSQDCNKTVTCS